MVGNQIADSFVVELNESIMHTMAWGAEWKKSLDDILRRFRRALEEACTTDSWTEKQRDILWVKSWEKSDWNGHHIESQPSVLFDIEEDYESLANFALKIMS